MPPYTCWNDQSLKQKILVRIWDKKALSFKVGIQNSTATSEDGLTVSLKTTIFSPHNPVIVFLSMYSKELNIYDHIKTFMWIFQKIIYHLELMYYLCSSWNCSLCPFCPLSSSWSLQSNVWWRGRVLESNRVTIAVHQGPGLAICHSGFCCFKHRIWCLTQGTTWCVRHWCPWLPCEVCDRDLRISSSGSLVHDELIALETRQQLRHT